MSEATEEWARVEIMGHRMHYGRIAEVQRFGATMLRVEIPGAEPDAWEALYYGGASIFSVTPCDEDTARRGAERLRPRPWTPPARLEVRPDFVEFASGEDDDEGDDDGPQICEPAPQAAAPAKPPETRVCERCGETKEDGVWDCRQPITAKECPLTHFMMPF